MKKYFKTEDNSKLCLFSGNGNDWQGSKMLIASNYDIDMPFPHIRIIEHDNKKTDKSAFYSYYHAVQSFGKEITREEFHQLLQNFTKELLEIAET